MPKRTDQTEVFVTEGSELFRNRVHFGRGSIARQLRDDLEYVKYLNSDEDYEWDIEEAPRVFMSRLEWVEVDPVTLEPIE